ncbi:MAG: hypothetical protein K8F30_09120, partial [Taibaiella sp.]|nr:hypothetical protein [Taibaiella sp.]
PIYILLLLLPAFSACNDSDNPTGQAPAIKMGDPATIVTETDSQYLADVVPDLKMNTGRPATIASTKPDSIPPAVDTAQVSTQSATSSTPAGAGLRVPFPQAEFFIPDITVKTYKEPNLETDYGASYEITEGTLVDNKIYIKGANIDDVYMRYQTIIVARNDLGTLPLESLRKLTDWKKLKGSNGVYEIDLEPKKLEGLKVSNKAIRNAVNRDARNRNWSRSGIQKWVNSLRNVKSSTSKPMHTELRSVMWKVTGKDANGRPFQRQLRIDVPIAP